MAIDPKKHYLGPRALGFISQYYEGLDTHMCCAIPPNGAHVFLIEGQRSHKMVMCGGLRPLLWISIL
jgi:hypothetical protein